MLLISILSSIALCFLIIFTGLFIGSWINHLNETKDSYFEYGPANYTDFIKEFNKIKEWEHIETIPMTKTVMYMIGEDARIRGNIIHFRNKRMLITNIIDYFLIHWFLRGFAAKYQNPNGFYREDLWRSDIN